MTKSDDRRRYPCCGVERGTTHKLSCPHNSHRMPPRQRRTFDPPDMTDEPVFLGVDPAKPYSDQSVLSIGKIENPTLTFQPMPINLCFSDGDGNEIGKFEYDKEAKRWTFEGNMDEAAKQFAKFMYAHFQSLIEGDRDKLLDDAITDMYGGVPADLEEKLVESVEKVWPEHTPMPGSYGPDWMKVHVQGNFDDEDLERKYEQDVVTKRL